MFDQFNERGLCTRDDHNSKCVIFISFVYIVS